jgi:hypothetical protein
VSSQTVESSVAETPLKNIEKNNLSELQAKGHLEINLVSLSTSNIKFL